MATRSGLVGVFMGILATAVIAYPLAVARYLPISILLAAVIFTCGGTITGRWHLAVSTFRRVLLGAVTGGTAGIILFCLLGAAFAGVTIYSLDSHDSAGITAAIVILTQKIFLIAFLGGIGSGALGGWAASPRGNHRIDSFDKSDPQMALNVSITATPASVFAACLSAAVFSRMSSFIGNAEILDAPLTVSMLLTLLSHLALILVIPHETRQAESRCGMNEVKMAAFVAIATAPTLAFFLSFAGMDIFLNPRAIIMLAGSALMSLWSLYLLFHLVLPRRDSFPHPQEENEKTVATFFGTIADSRADRLIMLCIGCGAVMTLPLYVNVISVLVNLSASAQNLFWRQAFISMGMSLASITSLILIYMLYLHWGRRFKRRLHLSK